MITALEIRITSMVQDGGKLSAIRTIHIIGEENGIGHSNRKESLSYGAMLGVVNAKNLENIENIIASSLLNVGNFSGYRGSI